MKCMNTGSINDCANLNAVAVAIPRPSKTGGIQIHTIASPIEDLSVALLHKNRYEIGDPWVFPGSMEPSGTLGQGDPLTDPLRSFIAQLVNLCS